jgi:hypothetical protein
MIHTTLVILNQLPSPSSFSPYYLKYGGPQEPAWYPKRQSPPPLGGGAGQYDDGWRPLLLFLFCPFLPSIFLIDGASQRGKKNHMPMPLFRTIWYTYASAVLVCKARPAFVIGLAYVVGRHGTHHRWSSMAGGLADRPSAILD